MRLGAILPQFEIGPDAGAVRAFAQGLEDMGLDHLILAEHVLGASRAAYPPERLQGPYREDDPWHDPFVLFGFLAGITRTIAFGTSVLVLPQRQAALAAKQAAEVDILSGGRLRLGIGIGWNWVEFEALGVPYEKRGARVDEQIELMRLLWTKPIITYRGKFHTVTDAGLNPLPIQKPIPLWIGGQSDAAMRRAARTGDGWLPIFPEFDPMYHKVRPWTLEKVETPDERMARFKGYLKDYNRDLSTYRIESRLIHGRQNPDYWRKIVTTYRAMGVTDVTIGTVRTGFTTADAHLAAIREVRDAVADLL